MRTLSTLAAAAILSVAAPAVAVAAPSAPSQAAAPAESAVEQPSADAIQPRAGVAGSGIGIGLVDASGPYIVADAEPGDVITRTVRVTNNTGTARDVSVYPGPAWMRGGVFSVEQEGASNALTDWTTVSEPTVHLGLAEQKTVDVTIRVPSDVPAGELYGAVWAAVDGARVGVRMYVTVGGDNGTASDFSITGLTGDRRPDGSAVVLATVDNTGSLPITLDGTVRLSGGPGGAWVDAVPAQPSTIPAGESGQVRFIVPGSADLAAGPWQAKARIHSGYFQHETEGTVTFPDAPTAPEQPDSPSGSLASLGSLTGSLGSLGD